MMNKLNKRFYLLLAISCAIIVLGAILYGVLGFNNAADKLKSYTFEVQYNVVVDLNEESKAEIEKLCEDTFKANGLSYTGKTTRTIVDSSSLVKTDNFVLSYTFSDKANAEKLAAAMDAVNAQLGDEAFASWHSLAGSRFYDPAWRGAIAIAVAAIVALVYITVRFGVSCGVAGLAICAHDALLTAALFAVTRFPVYAAAPVLYAAIAALVSLLLWTVLCGKMKEAFKLNAGAGSEELIRTTVSGSWKTVVFSAAVVGAIVVVLGAVAVGGTALLVLPAILGVAVPVYSTLFLAPEICVPVRKYFDKKRADKKGGYIGKKKAAATDTDAE